MLPELIALTTLLALTVIVHASGMMLLLRWLLRVHTALGSELWASTRLMVRTLWCIIALHLLEIAIWASFYWWRGYLPDAESAFYFSGTTYTTVGYGDLLLPKNARLIGPIEGLAGILMCGLSAAFFFAVMSKLFRGATDAPAESGSPPAPGSTLT